jgi:hypothetical protein
MTLAELLQAAPQFHERAGRPFSWQASKHVLGFIDTHVGPGDSTLEVGAGVSTVLFALKGARHRCIVPFRGEVERIIAFCRAQKISTEGLQFDVGPSDYCLPRLVDIDLDLVLIDGAHGFPVPFLDWHYTAGRLKVGGLCIIDDTQIWTGHTLKQFLLHEPEWQLETDFAPRSVVFRKVRECQEGKNETFQPYVMAESRAIERRRRARAAMGRLIPRPITTFVKTFMGR